MRVSSYKKFNKYILEPDMANKFLLTHPNTNSLKQSYVSVQYIFRQKNPISFTPIKFIMMLSSITPKILNTSQKIILLKFTKAQTLSNIFILLNSHEFFQIFSIYLKKPSNIETAIKANINENSHFIFPGFINHLKLPSWKQYLNIQIKKPNYWFLFKKTAFIE